MRITRAAMAAVVLTCLIVGTGLAQEPWCWNADVVRVEVQGEGTVVVHHDGAYYNCCPDPIVYDLVVQEHILLMKERTLEDPPCDCLCCFDLQATLTDVPPGNWLLVFQWFDLESQGWTSRSVPFAVPPYSGADTPAVGDHQRSPCLDESTGVTDPPPLTWTRVKGQYR